MSSTEGMCGGIRTLMRICPKQRQAGRVPPGKGELYVNRDTGEGVPYSGISNIVSGEIAEDITYYFATSEQVPTLCALGVLVDTDWSCLAAGGILIQLLPYADESIIDILEQNRKNIPSFTTLIKENTLEEVIAAYLKGIEYDIFDEITCGYECKCSRYKTDTALIALGREELGKLANTPENISMQCQFCDKNYVYTPAEIQRLIKELS